MKVTKIIERKMQITYNFNGTKIKRGGTVPQIGSIYEIEDNAYDISPSIWKVVDVIHRVSIDDAPDIAEHIEVVLFPSVINRIESPIYTSTSTG